MGCRGRILRASQVGAGAHTRPLIYGRAKAAFPPCPRTTARHRVRSRGGRRGWRCRAMSGRPGPASAHDTCRGRTVGRAEALALARGSGGRATTWLGLTHRASWKAVQSHGQGRRYLPAAEAPRRCTDSTESIASISPASGSDDEEDSYDESRSPRSRPHTPPASPRVTGRTR